MNYLITVTLGIYLQFIGKFNGQGVNTSTPRRGNLANATRVVRVGMMVTEVRQNEIGFSTTGGAIPLVIDQIRNEHLLDDFNFEFYLNYTDCDEAKAAAGAAYLIIDAKVDVIIGPPCTTSAIPVAMLGTYYQSLQVTWGYSVSQAFSNNERFPFVSALTANTLQLGFSLVEILDLYSWNNFAIVYMSDSLGYCDNLVTDVETAIQDPTTLLASVSFKVRLAASATQSDFNTQLLRVKSRARIVVSCMPDNQSNRRLLIAMNENEMMNNEYVYIMLEMKGFGFGQVGYSDKEVLDNGYTAIWIDTIDNNADGKDDLARQAANRVFVLGARNDVTVDMAATRDEIFERVRDWPFYCNTTDCLQNANRYPGVGSFTTQLYDAFYYFALALNKTTEASPESIDINKTMYMQLRSDIKFFGWSGNVEINQNGTRIPQFFLFGIDSQYKQQVYVNLTYAGMANYMIATPTYTNEYTTVWQPWGGVRPRARPACGYAGDMCPQTVWEASGAYIIAGICVAFVLFVFFIFIIIYVIRARQKETERLNAEWQVPFSMLQRPDSKIDNRSMHSLRSSKSGKSSYSKFSLGSKKSETEDIAYFYFADDIIMAVKQRTHIKFTSQDFTEYRLMRKMEHDNLNRFIGMTLDHSPILSLWKLCSRGNLEDVIAKSSVNMDGFFMFSIIRDIAEGMFYLHKSFLEYHGNLSAMTCLIDDRWQVKISNFGLKNFLLMGKPTKKEMLYQAPEVLRHDVDGGSRMADVYSFSIIASQIITKKSAFDLENRDEKVEEILYRIKKGSSPPLRPDINIDEDIDINPALMHLIRDCWSQSPDSRPEFDTIKNLLKSMGAGRQQNLMDHVFNILESYAETLEKEVEDRMGELVEEKKKSDILLYRMLPRQVADKLKLGQSVEPESYDSVTIFFSDVVKFTSLAARCTPLQIVNLLNDLYTTFDTIIELHSVYKVETIGDGYLCVSGLPHRNGIQHVRDIAEMSLGFLQAIQECPESAKIDPDNCNWSNCLPENNSTFRISHLPNERVNLRIGMHTGSCVAGVVGMTMPRYCLFGDTVNTASRMESNGRPGQIHVSDTSNELLHRIGGYVTESRGEVIIKGKGVMETYWLRGRSGEVSNAFAPPIPQEIQKEFTRSESMTLPSEVPQPGMYRSVMEGQRTDSTNNFFPG